MGFDHDDPELLEFGEFDHVFTIDAKACIFLRIEVALEYGNAGLQRDFSLA